MFGEDGCFYIVRLNKRRFMGRKNRLKDFRYDISPGELRELQDKHGLFPIEWGEVPKGGRVSVKYRNASGEEREASYMLVNTMREVFPQTCVWTCMWSCGLLE